MAWQVRCRPVGSEEGASATGRTTSKRAVDDMPLDTELESKNGTPRAEQGW